MAQWTELTNQQKGTVATSAEACICLSTPSELPKVIQDTDGINPPVGPNLRSLLLSLFADVDNRRRWPEFLEAVELHEGSGTETLKGFEKALVEATLVTPRGVERRSPSQFPKDQYHFFDLQPYYTVVRDRMRETNGLIGFSVPHAEDRFLEALAKRIQEHPKLRENPSKIRKKQPYRLNESTDWSTYRDDVARAISRPGHCIIHIVPHREPERVWYEITAMVEGKSIDGYKFIFLAGDCVEGQQLAPLTALPRVCYLQSEIEDWLVEAFEYKSQQEQGWGSPDFAYIESLSASILAQTTNPALQVLKVYESLEIISAAFSNTSLDTFKKEIEESLQ